MNVVALRRCTKTVQLLSGQNETAKTASAIFLCAILGNHHLSRRRSFRDSQAFACLKCDRVKKAAAQMKGFPTFEEVENANKEQLARWYRFLPSGETVADRQIMKRIAERFEKLGGMTAELSKKIGM
jgi:hypothetical protein